MSSLPELSALPAYFSEIEEAFCARRNAPLLLSPLDFEKIASWHAAGIPVEVVRNGISRYFDKLDKRKTPLRRAICVSFAEGCVLRALDEFRQARIGAQCGIGETAADERSRKEKFLGHLEEKLQASLAARASQETHDRSSALLSAILNMIAGLRSDEKVSLIDVEERLSPLDAELGRLLLSETPDDLCGKWRAESRERMKKAGMASDDAIAAAAEKNILVNRAFSHAGIPRLSILYHDE